MKRNRICRIFRRAVLISLTLLLTGCTANKDYSREDAEEYSRKDLGIRKYEILSEETGDDGRDTIWTFRETGGLRLVYHIVEDHYVTGIDASSWEAGRLLSDYNASVTGLCLEGLSLNYSSLRKDYYREPDIVTRYRIYYDFSAVRVFMV